MGTALHNALGELETKAKSFSEVAADHVRDFCAGAKVEMCDPIPDATCVTATFREETDTELERLAFHARHSDLVVIGRARQTQGLAPDTLETLILNCGRPLLIAATTAPQTLTDTVMVCWKETNNAARAVAAATPILSRAKRVIFAHATERGEGDGAAAEDIAHRFAWRGVSTEAKIIPAHGKHIPQVLAAAAAECKADLVVMGAYGHSRAHELFFGSCTESVIDDADRPILLMH
jgi:nucleotide-binding universal stress UspA family protein